MVLSKRTSAHVHTVFEVNYTRIEQIRKARKSEYEASGGEADVPVLHREGCGRRAAPDSRDERVARRQRQTSRITGRSTSVVAVSLDWGLIVPVIKSADEKNLLASASDCRPRRPRARQAAEARRGVGWHVHGDQPGGIGAQFGLPIINQPQVGILGVGAIEKRAVVIEDAIGIRLMGYLSLAFDHRVVDGAVGDQFMGLIKHQLENWDPNRA
jgi:2-oxoglutarate dehydrogenase E2 component (dihydrolipoamide succinyltransferase)